MDASQGRSQLEVRTGDGELVRRFEFFADVDDLILPIVLPLAVERSIETHGQPEPPLTEAEQAMMAELDADPPAEPGFDCGPPNCCYPAGPELPPAEGVREIDLRRDFKVVCREGPPGAVGDWQRGLDPRPPCRLGPTWGYLRPRSWVLLGLTATALAGTASLYAVSATASDPAVAGPTRAGGHAMVGVSVGLGAVLGILVASDRRQARRALGRELARGR